MATPSNGHSDETTSLLREEQASDSNKHDYTSDIAPLAVGNQKLERQIDWKTASLINVSYMVGGGVFVSPALTLAMVGSGAGGIASQSTVFGRYLNFALFGSSASTPALDRVWAGKFIEEASVLCGLMDTDADYMDNLSFNGTTMSFKPYASAFYFSMHGYSGFNAIQYSLDEVKNPIQNLPKIAGSALGLTSVLYLLTIISYMLVLPNEVIKNSDLTVAGSFNNWPQPSVSLKFSVKDLRLEVYQSLLVLASLIFSGSRLVLEASRDGLLPYGHTFGYVNPSFQAPVNALVLQYVIVLVYLLATPGGVYQFIIAFAAWPAYIFFACIGIGVFLLRRREPELARPFKANSGFVLIFILFSIYELCFVFVPVPSPDYPYWLPYATAIVAMVIWTVLWLSCAPLLQVYQVLILDTPSKSYNQQILQEGREELARDVYE
ncbi:hypothetical protein NQZ79_g2998 [Umbelopsis isabellina]|nr:hypothetical protein NQZ79_g2998 [Umbelopsis isabellina]